MKTIMNSEGMVVEEPTERFKTIVRYSSSFINGAYKPFDTPVPGKSKEEAFVQMVHQYNSFASLVNNIASDRRYNTSSLFFYYFYMAGPAVQFDTIFNTLADVQRGNPDVEVDLFSNVLQLCPGLMTIMFFMINNIKYQKSITLLHSLNSKFKLLTTLKGHVGKYEAIEMHTEVSKLIEQIVSKCCDLLITQKNKHNAIVEYMNVLFLRSGLLKDASSSTKDYFFF